MSHPSNRRSSWVTVDMAEAVNGLGSSSPDGEQFCVTADLLIPGKGKPLTNGCIVVKGNTIQHVGAVSDLLATYGHMRQVHVKVLMPGMWDCHVHLLGITQVSSQAIVTAAQSQALAGARSARDVMLLLNAGFTSVREMAGYGLQLEQAIQEGTVVGPKIYSSNAIISSTGGHADVHDMPLDWYYDACAHGAPMCIADGVPECMKAVRKQIRAGADVIKICGSGGVGSERDNPIDQQFTLEEMKAMVEVATQNQRLVGAHCHGKAGIIAALEAGVKTIEHGSYLDEESADLMIKKDAVLVATRLIIENALKKEDMLTPVGFAKLKVVAEAHWKALRLAIKKGVILATGTDTGISVPGERIGTQGSNGKELVYLVQAGMSELKAIEAATANGPLTLGPRAPMSGQLKAGYDADFIGLDADPLKDITILAKPAHVTHVWRAGKAYKWPGHPITSSLGI